MTKRRSRLALVGSLFGLMFLSTASFGGTVLSADDAVVMPGRQTLMTAYLQKSLGLGHRKGVEEASVSFLANNRQVGACQTQDKGLATTTCMIPAGKCSKYQVRAQVGRKVYTTEARVFNWDPNRTIIAVDIDETISVTAYGDLLLTSKDHFSRPIRGSVEVLNELAKDYHIVYLTCRPRFLMDRTRDWLTRKGFPAGPLITPPSWKEWRNQSRFKTEKLAELRRHWPNLLIGIGDKGVDVNGYSANRMLSLIVNESDVDEYGDRALGLENWAAVRQYFVENRPALSNPTVLASRVGTDGRLGPPAQPTAVALPRPGLASEVRSTARPQALSGQPLSLDATRAQPRSTAAEPRIESRVRRVEPPPARGVTERVPAGPQRPQVMGRSDRIPAVP